MTSVFLGIIGAGVMLSLGFSIVSLFLHWKRTEEHPDTTAFNERLSGLANELIDLQDRVGQWMKRDSVRKARQGRQERQEPEPDATQGPVTKAELRSRLGQLRGVPSK